MLKDIDESYIFQNETLNNSFKSATLKDINENCKILNSQFYLDSFNYFPITKNNETFLLKEISTLLEEKNYKKFYTQIITLDSYETYFKETINQIQIANDFKTLINQTI